MTRITADNESLYLFSCKLISHQVQDALPEGYTMRPLRYDDYDKGILQVLDQLSTVGTVTKEQYQERFETIRKHGSSYVIIIEDHGRIVASATLVVEHKFLHECGSAGHIEDVVVHDSQRGKKLGYRLIEQLNYLAGCLGCYKTTLNCKAHNIPFYEKCQMNQADIQMSRYFGREKMD